MMEEITRQQYNSLLSKNDDLMLIEKLIRINPKTLQYSTHILKWGILRRYSDDSFRVQRENRILLTSVAHPNDMRFYANKNFLAHNERIFEDVRICKCH